MDSISPSPPPQSGQSPPRRRKRDWADFYRALIIAHLPHVANEYLGVSVALDAYEWTREEQSHILGEWEKIDSAIRRRVSADLAAFPGGRLDRYVDARVRQLRGRRRGRPPRQSGCKNSGSGNVCLFNISNNREGGSPNGIAPGNAGQNGDEAGWHVICSSNTPGQKNGTTNISRYDWLSVTIDSRECQLRNQFVYSGRSNFSDGWGHKTVWRTAAGTVLRCRACPKKFPFSPYETWDASGVHAAWFHRYLEENGIDHGVSRCDSAIDVTGENLDRVSRASEYLMNLADHGKLFLDQLIDKNKNLTRYFFDSPKKRVLLRIYAREDERVELQIRPNGRDRRRFAGVDPDAIWSVRDWTARVFELLTGEPPPPLPPRQKPLDEFARATCPPDKPFVRVPVVGSSGLFLRVGKRTRTWAANRNGTTITLGQYPAMSAAQAKQALRRYDRAQSQVVGVKQPKPQQQPTQALQPPVQAQQQPVQVLAYCPLYPLPRRRIRRKSYDRYRAIVAVPLTSYSLRWEGRKMVLFYAAGPRLQQCVIGSCALSQSPPL
ncbi:integrase arm-type DNA-binding domain-containing protein [Vandammella animalimorsus]|uniref:integrase arm-type DNA-binding domain-containing protein n=1 Tax=Vandammella animalimorsus TaxID=2029117 RepID=UPI0026AC641C